MRLRIAGWVLLLPSSLLAPHAQHTRAHTTFSPLLLTHHSHSSHPRTLMYSGSSSAHYGTGAGNGSGNGHGTPFASSSRNHSALDHYPSNSATPPTATRSSSSDGNTPLSPTNGGVFDRVVRKLSKKVKPPSSGSAVSSARRGSNTERDVQQQQAHSMVNSDPPSYTSVAGAGTGTAGPSSAAATSSSSPAPASHHRKVSSRQRAEVPEWGPPPLTDQRFRQTLAEQAVAAEEEQAESTQGLATTSTRRSPSPRQSASVSRRTEKEQLQQQQRQQRQQRQHAQQPSQSHSQTQSSWHPTQPSRHHPSHSMQSKAPIHYATLASRSFDSLVGSTDSTAAGAYPQQRTPSESPPQYAYMSARSPPAAGATGLTRKPTISSTTRGKPAADIPLANVTSTGFPAGYWPPSAVRAAADKDDGAGLLSEEELRRRARERDELVGRGPYWSIQRGWSKGVVNTLDEANRRTRGFPGPIVRYFPQDQLDEALEFYRLGNVRPSGVSRSFADDDGHGAAGAMGGGKNGDGTRDDGDEAVKRASQTSIALGRSVSLMDRTTQQQRATGAMARKQRHARGMQQSMSDAVRLEAPATPTATAAAASTPPPPIPVLSGSALTQVIPVLTTHDLTSSVKFYTGIVGFQVLTHVANQQATLGLASNGPPCVQLRVVPTHQSVNPSSLCVHTTHDLQLIRARVDAAMRASGDEGGAVSIRDPSGHLVFFQSTALMPSLSQDSLGDETITSLRNTTTTTTLSPSTTMKALPSPRRAFSPNNPFLRPNTGGADSRPVSPAALPESMNPFLTATTAAATSTAPIAIPTTTTRDGNGVDRLNPHLSLHLGSPFDAGGEFGQTAAGGGESGAVTSAAAREPWTRVADESD